MNISDNTWALVAKSLAGETNAAEQQALQQLLQQDAALQQQYDVLQRIWHAGSTVPEAASATKTFNNKEIRAIIHKATVLENKQRRKTVQWNRRWMMASAAILIIVVTAVWLWPRPGGALHNGNSMAHMVPALSTANGKRIKATLPDGSIVWLNAASKIFYETDFKGATREVRLEGEAFFDIVKKTGQPFIVHTNNIQIRVLGTAFNVKAYKEDDNVETTLYRGLVNITKTDDKGFQPIMLYPNQKIIVPKTYDTENSAAPLQQPTLVTLGTTRPSILMKPIDSTQAQQQRIETAWMYNRLEFRGEDFASLAHKMMRWYNVKIFFTDKAVQQLSFNGSFENETIEQALIALKTANDFHYKMVNNEIHISSQR